MAPPDPSVLLEAVRSGQVNCAAFDDITLRDIPKGSELLNVQQPAA